MAQYVEAHPVSRELAEAAFRSEDEKRISEALVRLALHDPDWQWVQGQCLHFAQDPRPGVRGAAATCLGHLARIHGVLGLDSVLPVLHELRNDPVVSGRAQDALDDIEIYTGVAQTAQKVTD